MPSKNPAQRLCDIIDNIDAIAAFTTDLDFAAFRAGRRTVYAVVRALEIISEASRRLPDELLHRHPEIDWWRSRLLGIFTGMSMTQWMKLCCGTRSPLIWLPFEVRAIWNPVACRRSRAPSTSNR